MASNGSNILVLNSGSSSIKFAVFAGATQSPEPDRLLSGALSGIGSGNAELKIGSGPSTKLDAPDHPAAIAALFTALESNHGLQFFKAVGHRIVHGGPKHFEPAIVNHDLIADLKSITAFAPEHMPQAIALIEAIAVKFPSIPQITCFDTAFHQYLPTVSRTLPLPRRLQAFGVRRYGFHGLSYEFLMRELTRIGKPNEADGRIILAHLGNGASMAAVHRGKPIDTTMGMTPAGGLVMGSRTGDIDPGIVRFLQRHEQLSPEQFDKLVNHESGLRGVSETTSDMRQLAALQKSDPRAAEAIDLFCYAARKWIGALTAALGGLDTLVFSGGIGEHDADARQRICAGLECLGIQIDSSLNQQNAAIICPPDGQITVRVIATDEETTIVRAVTKLLSEDGSKPELSK